MLKEINNKIKYNKIPPISFIIFFILFFLMNYFFSWDSSGYYIIKPFYKMFILNLLYIIGASIMGRKFKQWRFVLLFLMMIIIFYILSCMLVQDKSSNGYFLLSMNFLIFFLSTVSISLINGFFVSGMIIRNILYIAGKSIVNYTDGYTTRPYPFRKINASFDELKEFAEFLQKKIIGTAYYKEDIILIAFSSGVYQYIPGMEPDWNKVTYISIDKDGKISVKISLRDYKKFVKEVSFDELCTSFGEMIIDLFNRYKKGERNEIYEYIEYNKPPSFIFSEKLSV